MSICHGGLTFFAFLEKYQNQQELVFAFPKIPCMRSLYYSLVYPYLIYCVSVWGSIYQSNLNRVIILQKTILRLLSKVSFDSHTGVLFNSQTFIYTKQVNLCTFLKEAFSLLIIFVICLPSQARYILIIHKKNSAYSIYLNVELIFENSQFGYMVLSFQLAKSGNSKQ